MNYAIAIFALISSICFVILYRREHGTTRWWTLFLAVGAFLIAVGSVFR